MPRSGWLRYLASKVAIPLLFLLIGGLVVGYFIRLGLQEEWASRRDAQTRSEQYAETKQNPEYNGCARLPPIHQKDCFAEANDAGRANQRSARDLVAQETTASWTFITSLAALVGACSVSSVSA